VSTLITFLSNAVGRVEEGFSEVMFRILKLRVKDLQKRDRQCSLVFDEMSTKCQLNYNKSLDKIIGHTADGELANEALVFMIRGLSMKWKQAIAYFYTHNTVATTELAEHVSECVRLVDNVGLTVRCVVCDQGPTNECCCDEEIGFTVESPKNNR
jgi:hypothetical protein